MAKSLALALSLMLASVVSMHASSKRHVVVLGRPTTVTVFLSNEGQKAQSLQIRPLYVDGRLKEFTTGVAHDITDHQFVIQRAFRVNDLLPDDRQTLPKWRWQRGNWLLVDRSAGRVSTLHLPSFDPFYSEVAWYRDYAAYCGVTEEGDRLLAVVAQAGGRKPIASGSLRSLEGTEAETPCRSPVWQRLPARATFTLKEGKTLTLTVRGGGSASRPPEAPAPAETEE